ncbi:hypothetical protein F5Y10DRAFT_251716 [Nemania abortiva]|nr:hypothetical protein F5Y10DRAFT_251716 [Nemania abortiva]
MSTTENESPRISIDGDGERPHVRTYVQKPVFCVGDKVYLINAGGTREGPYLVASLPSEGKCTLSLESGAAVNNADEVSLDSIEAA